MPDSFSQLFQQEGLIKALWVCGSGLVLFFFKEVYYAPTKFVTIVSFKEWRKDLGADIKENKDNLKEFIVKQEDLTQKDRDKQEERYDILYKSLNNRDNELRQFIITTMQGRKKDE